MARIFRYLSLFSIIAFWATSASSNVIYSFEALSSLPYSLGSLTGGFVYESPTFISVETIVTPAQLTSGSIASDTVTGLVLGDVQISPNWGGGGYDMIGFRPDILKGTITYYFDLGAFGAVGKYDTVVFGTDQQGILTVSLAPVPEPETYAMLLAGLGLIGAAVKRRKAK